MPLAQRIETIDLVSSPSSSSSSGEELGTLFPLTRRDVPPLRRGLDTAPNLVADVSAAVLPPARSCHGEQLSEFKASTSSSHGSDSEEDDDGMEADLAGTVNTADLVLTLSSRKGETVLPGADLARALRADERLWCRVLLLEPVKLKEFVLLTERALTAAGMSVGRGLTGRDRLALRAWLEQRGVCVWTDD